MTDWAPPARAFVPFALERWFAAQAREWICDLSASGAIPLTLEELLAIAEPAERSAYARTPLGYGPPDGSAALRELIAGRLDHVRPDEVIVTCGAIEALHLSVSALLAPGDEVIVQQPMYPAVAGMARALGASVRPWTLEHHAGYRPNIAALARLVTPRTRVVAITQPNNPTGAVFDGEELDRIFELVDSIGAWLISDEVYRDLALEPGLVAPSAAERYERAISVGDVAKPFGLGGLRIGWLVAHDAELRERIRARRDYTTLSVPTASDALAKIALRHAEQLVSRPTTNARRNVESLAALDVHDERFSFVPPRAGLTAFVRVGAAMPLQQLLAADGILVVPGDLFDAPAHVRMWLGGPVAEFTHAVERITWHLARLTSN